MLRTSLIVIFSAVLSAPVSPRSAAAAARASPPGQECPPGTTEMRPGSCQAPSEPRAEHSRLSAEQHAGHRRAQGAEGEVPGHRHAQPPGAAHPGLDEAARRDDGPAQPARPDARRQHQRRSPGPDRSRRSTRRRTRIASARSPASTSATSVRAGRTRRFSSCAPTSRPARSASAKSASSLDCASPSRMARD